MSYTEWTGDQMYILISGGNLAAPVEIHTEFKMVKIDPSVDPIETTRGANKEHKEFRPGMNEYPLEIRLGIDSNDIYPEHLQLGQIYDITIAPNGNVAGEPIHQQAYFIESIPLEVETGKGERIWATKWKQAGAPTQDFFRNAKVPAA
ncbi:MAG: hypothetical protein AAFN11_14425 [Chloroflexota bacterium]